MTAQTASNLTARARALLTALALAVALCASVVAEPADASVEGVCTHDTSVHYGSDGQAHGSIFEEDWLRWDGTYMHRVSHWHRVPAPNGGGKWFRDWERSFKKCHDTVYS